jgi:zinc transport system ATP-binding protein
MPITVEEVVLMGRFPHAGFGRITADDRERTRAALRKAGIDHLAEKRITKLSGGQRQRSYIARALAGEADLLVFDEPTVGIDAESIGDFFSLLDDLNRDGMSILLVEHDIEAVIEHTERVLCLNGELYFDGPSEAFPESDALERAYGITTGERAEVTR